MRPSYVAMLLVRTCVLFVPAVPTLAGPQDVLYIHGTHPPAIDGETLRLDDTSNLGYSGFRDALAGAGFSLTEFEAGPGSTGLLTDELLRNYQAIILSSNNRLFSDDEAAAVDRFVRAGGGIVAWSDAAFGWDQDNNGQLDPPSIENNTGITNTIGLDSDNTLTTQFGMRFLRDTGVQAIVGQDQPYLFEHPIWQANAGDDGVIAFKGEGVSPIVVSGEAEVLFAYQDASLPQGGNPTGLTAADEMQGFALDASVAALAIAEPGWGRVVGTFDRNTFWNNGSGTNINEFDNRQFAINLVTWATSGPLAGDYNRDGQVDLGDYTVWRDALGQSGTELLADGNADTTVDALDYDLWKSNFALPTLDTVPAAAAEVPEPKAACWALVWAAAIVLRLRRPGSAAAFSRTPAARRP